MKKFLFNMIGWAFIITTILIGLYYYFDSDSYVEKETKKKEAELLKAEKECRYRGMYPFRFACSDILSVDCHVVCWNEPMSKE